MSSEERFRDSEVQGYMDLYRTLSGVDHLLRTSQAIGTIERPGPLGRRLFASSLRVHSAAVTIQHVYVQGKDGLPEIERSTLSLYDLSGLPGKEINHIAREILAASDPIQSIESTGVSPLILFVPMGLHYVLHNRSLLMQVLDNPQLYPDSSEYLSKATRFVNRALPFLRSSQGDRV